MNISLKSLGVAAAAAALAFMAPAAAQATTVLVNGSFAGGGTVTGSISFGSGTMWHLTTTGGPLGSFTYSNLDPHESIVAINASTFDVFESDGFPNSFSDLRLVFQNDLLTTANNTADPVTSGTFECWNSFVCPKSEAQFPGFFLQAVPEPATWAMMLLGVGLAGFGLRAAARRAQPQLARI